MNARTFPSRCFLHEYYHCVQVGVPAARQEISTLSGYVLPGRWTAAHARRLYFYAKWKDPSGVKRFFPSTEAGMFFAWRAQFAWPHTAAVIPEWEGFTVCGRRWIGRFSPAPRGFFAKNAGGRFCLVFWPRPRSEPPKNKTPASVFFLSFVRGLPRSTTQAGREGRGTGRNRCRSVRPCTGDRATRTSSCSRGSLCGVLFFEQGPRLISRSKRSACFAHGGRWPGLLARDHVCAFSRGQYSARSAVHVIRAMV